MDSSVFSEMCVTIYMIHDVISRKDSLWLRRLEFKVSRLKGLSKSNTQ
jgi:hypothetical protein